MKLLKQNVLFCQVFTWKESVMNSQLKARACQTRSEICFYSSPEPSGSLTPELSGLRVNLYYTNRGGSRISGKGVHIYIKVRGFALLILSHFS